MTDLSNWKYLYKIIKGAGEELWTTNMLYTPLINQEGTVLCMSWDETSEYQKDNKNLSAELVDFFYQREVKHLTMFQQKQWAPKIIEIDSNKKQIFLEWNNKNINHIIFKDGNIDKELPTWKQDIKNILKDFLDAGYYKLALYPHCFFIGADGIMKTTDFYSCVGIEERYIPYNNLKGMIGNDSTNRFKNAKVDELIDFKIFFENTIETHMDKVWPDNPFDNFIKLQQSKLI
jgi:hypothetical protein